MSDANGLIGDSQTNHDTATLRAMNLRTLTLVATMIVASLASAQETPPSLAESSEATVERFRDWTLQCLPEKGAQPETCAMIHEVLLENGRRLMAVQVTETSTVANPGEPSLVVVLSLPLGVYLPSGVQFTIDDKPPLNLEFERCDRGGCYAGVVLGEALNAAMKGGVDSIVRFNNLAGRTINAKVSLRGFTSAYNALLAKLP